MTKWTNRFVNDRLQDATFLPQLEEPLRKAEAESLAGKIEAEGYLVANDLGLKFEPVESESGVLLEAAQDGEVLRFRNAILARVETNKNLDEITSANIGELAATIVGRPIDIDHRIDQNAGIITEARVENDALVIGGILWRDRYPVQVDGVRKGSHHLSVEGLADTVLCSNCGGEFSDSKHYCTHLKARRATNTKRGFKQLNGKGAGITANPAGSGTVFDRNQIFVVASHTEETDMNCPHCGKEATGDKCPSCNKSTVPSVIASELAAATEALNALQPIASADAEAKATLTAQVTDLEAKLTAALTDVETKQAELKAKTDAERLAKVASLMTAEKLEERKTSILAMDVTAFNVFVASVEEATQADPRKLNVGPVRIPEKKPDNAGTRPNLSLR